MNKLCITSIALVMAMTSATPQLHHHSHYEVDRHLLEKGYSAFKSFKGSMHAGLLPAADIKKNADDFSEYFFWLFRPDGDDGEEKGKPESFRDDTLLIWLNGKIVVFDSQQWLSDVANS